MNPKIISTEPIDSDFNPVDDAAISEIHQFSVDATLHNQRLDKALSHLASGFSRSYLQTLIMQGDVLINHQPIVKSAFKVQTGTVLTVHLRPTPASTCFKPEPISLNAVYEDEYLLVINKAAGLVVHPAPGNWGGTVVNAMLHHAPETINLPRAGIVHRLDKFTSGLMVIAKTRPVMDALVKMIAAREVKRYYLAIARGKWKTAETVCVVNQAIGRDPVHRLKMAVLPENHAGAKRAVTAVKQLVKKSNDYLLVCKLFTGRTHQIRVHLSSLGLPIVGDHTYGGCSDDVMSRQALHAARLEFKHPINGQYLSLNASLPPDMQAYMLNADLTLPAHMEFGQWFDHLGYLG